ncbi:DUF4097 family beta strand repeat-containing protein [Streptomyces sp. NPDC021100]|uniref:DUF4097 family beta strand repeat-containing protein n=1 Tax=Streptomyces sp. NPDC021100 TaxID=3365114 RepID=UPI00378D1B00
MPVRTLTAPQAGPVLIDAQLLGAGGTVTVRTDRYRQAAEITIRTADDTGDSADAVRTAALRWDSRGALVAHVHSTGGTSGAGTVITGNSSGAVQTIQANGSSVIVMSGSGLHLGGSGSRFHFHGGAAVEVIGGASPIEITAVVPEGSSVTARTHSADVTADGRFAAICASSRSGSIHALGQAEQFTANTRSGDIGVENVPHLNVTAQSGSIRLGRTDLVEANAMSGDITIRDFGGTARLHTMSGDIRVHATAGGDLTAATMSGDITVTATEQAVNDDLDARATSTSGDVRLPQRRPHRTDGPRRRSN